MAFGYVNWSDNTTDHKVQSLNNTPNPDNYFVNLLNYQAEPGFFYDVDSRFMKTITKSDLHNAKSIQDLFSENEINGIESFRDVNIVVLPRDKNKFEKGDDNTLNSAQLAFLQSVDYSTDICIEAFCKRMMSETWKIEEQCFVYYITIVPEKEAEFKDGQNALIDYLKKNSTETVASVNKDQLKPGKVRFIVTKDGEIGHVALEATSGYTAIDEKMVKLIKSLPGEWEAATNLNGEKVDQELVYFFGLIGC